MVLTDASGNTVSERSFSDDEQPARILANADGTYALLTNGTYTRPGATTSVPAVRVRKLNADLSTGWETAITGLTESHNLTRTSDGGYLLTSLNDGSGATGGATGATNIDALAVRLGANGNLASSFALGGPDNEGSYASSGAPLSFPTATQTADGGFALTVTSHSYHLPDSLPHDLQRPDWWTVKTDATGRVNNFPGLMGSVPTTLFGVHDNTAPSAATMFYAGFPEHFTSQANFQRNPEPAFVPQDLGAKTGINKPTVVFQAAPAAGSAHAAFFAGESALGNGVYYLQFPSGNPFGFYSYLSDAHYVYHFDLGYEYVFEANDGRNGVFLFDFKSGGFFYTSPSFPFPYLYDSSLKSTVYYYPDPSNAGRYNTGGVRYFYVFNTGQIISK